MSESTKTKEEIAFDREQLVRGLTAADLDKLTDAQMKAVQKLQVKRMNERASLRVEESLKGKEKSLAAALSSHPFTYTSPDIKIMAGCTVRFSTLMTAQLRDAHKQLDMFLSKENPNDMRTGDYLNRHLLAHSLVTMNGEDFGGMSFDIGDYQALRKSSPSDAEKTMEAVRSARLDALDGLSSHLLQRLIETYQAFQITVEAMTQSQEMDEALGN